MTARHVGLRRAEFQAKTVAASLKTADPIEAAAFERLARHLRAARTRRLAGRRIARPCAA